MKWSFATIGIIMLGLIGVSIILLFQEITTNNENDYYLLKEVTEAAMFDAVDVSYYRETGNLRIVTEKFVENFTRRFAESTIFVTNDYKIEFYDIMEMPPKVSVVINTGLGEYTVGGNADEYGIANKLDAILETFGDGSNLSSNNGNNDNSDNINDSNNNSIIIQPNNPYVIKNKKFDNYYAILTNGNDNTFSLKIPDELDVPNIKNVKIASVKYIGVGNTQGDLNQALMRNELLYNNITVEFDDYLQSINGFSDSASNVNIDFHNCVDGFGDYKCDDINKYYIDIDCNISDKVILKYEVNWSYEEYEFSN